jgi:hypothetical protein
MGVPELRKLKAQDDEISRSKRLVADLMLHKQINPSRCPLRKTLRLARKYLIVLDLGERLKISTKRACKIL